MPIVEYVALNGKTIGQICGKHSRRSPAINRPCVDLVISVGIPERSKMCPIIVSTVLVFSEFKCAVCILQQPPIGFVIKFWEVSNSVLKLGMLSISRN